MGQSKKVLSAIRKEQLQQESIFKDTAQNNDSLHPLFKGILDSHSAGITQLLITKSNKNEKRNI